MSVQDERFEALLGAAAPLVASVFDALPDAIGVVWPAVDAAGALVDFEVGYTNPSSERMMGVRLGDEVGARLREVMPGVVPMGLYDRLLRVAETREAESAEITLDTMWRDAIHVSGRLGAHRVAVRLRPVECGVRRLRGAPARERAA